MLIRTSEASPLTRYFEFSSMVWFNDFLILEVWHLLLHRTVLDVVGMALCYYNHFNTILHVLKGLH